MAQGAAWLNDINGFAEPSLYDELADFDGQLVLMHAIQAKGIATRQDPPDGDIWSHIFRFFEARLAALEKAGVAHEKITLDPVWVFSGNKPEILAQCIGRIAWSERRIWLAGAGLRVAQSFCALWLIFPLRKAAR